MSPSSADIRAAVQAQQAEIASLFEALRSGSLDAQGPGVTRDSYGPGEQFAYRVIEERATRFGLEQRYDHAANLFMTLAGRDRSRPRIMMGSHLDSVANGGNFDGAAGVVAGLVAMRVLKSLAITPSCDVTTMAIRAEESVWFEVSYIGSRAAFGMLPAGALEGRRTDNKRSLAEHMRDCGADVGAVRAGKASLRAGDISAWVEVHIEQAPQLIEAGLPVAIGTGVPGNFRYPDVNIHGEWAHVGLPRRFRHDAVLAASDFAVGLDELWKAEEAAARPMASTIGRFFTDPETHGMTKVAGRVSLSLDFRAYDGAHLGILEEKVKQLATAVAKKRGVKIDLGRRTAAEVAPSNPALYAELVQAAADAGISTMSLPSPASHDTATFTVAGVPSCMLFVRNANGSHNPYESMELSDFLDATTVLAEWLARRVAT
jgi:N-carbamoyl-L-amino-acid hydrolase